MTSIVGARHLSKSFGAIAALKDVSLDIAPGEIRAICGENGAGKSTLVKLLTGVYRPDSGSVTVSGEPRAIATPRQAQELGIAFVAQELSLCPDLSVEDNIWLGSVKVPLLHKREEFSRRAREALELLGGGHIPLDAPAGRLAMGERQLVEIARMLTRDARVLILDEPTATLSDIEIERIFAALSALRREGKSVIYITHRLAEVFRICDRVSVLRNGELVDTLDVPAIDRKGLIEMMLGRPFVEMYPQPRAAAGAAALAVEDLCVPGRVERFSISVPKGKIVCIAGRSVPARSRWSTRSPVWCMMPAEMSTSRASRSRLVRPARALRRNVMFISGDRAEEGIFRRLRVYDNLIATRLADYASCGVLRRRALRATAAVPRAGGRRRPAAAVLAGR